jgi:hypothetical protein
MNRRRKFSIGWIFADERGQVLPLFALMTVLVLGMGGLVMDVGRAYFSHNELQASTDAAALAGAQILPNNGAVAEATTYSSLSTDDNAYANLPSVSMVPGYPLLKCLTSLSNIGIDCVAPANANAIQVKQETNVPTFFARLFGINSITVAASATAAMKGTATTPYNVAVIVDTTASMNDSDSDSSCNSTRLACELEGVQVMLQNMAPCLSSLTSCGTATANPSVGGYPSGGANVPNPVDVVALFTFPNVWVSTAPNDYTVPTSDPTIAYYSYPATGQSSYAPPGPATAMITPDDTSPAYTTSTTSPPGYSSGGKIYSNEWNATYRIVNFSSDYKTVDSTSTLNANSDLVIAVGGASCRGCNSMQAPGGAGTYYAGAIYAAQAALVAEQANRPNSQNVIVLISDGDATSTDTQMGGTTGGATNGGTYPSWVNECHQAITAANAATNATPPTRVIAVSYGSESSGCTTDSPSITPCSTMQHIASSAADFYSDYAQSGSGNDTTCVGTASPTTNLHEIFTDIAGTFSIARLIPDSAT